MGATEKKWPTQEVICYWPQVETMVGPHFLALVFAESLHSLCTSSLAKSRTVASRKKTLLIFFIRRHSLQVWSIHHVVSFSLFGRSWTVLQKRLDGYRICCFLGFVALFFPWVKEVNDWVLKKGGSHGPKQESWLSELKCQCTNEQSIFNDSCSLSE